PNVAGALGLAAAVRFLESFGRKELWRREQEMTEYALASLSKIKRLRILGPTKASERISVFSFVVENGKPLDVAALLDRLGVAVRAGDLASLPALVHGIQLVITRNYIENLRDEVRKGMREKAAQGIYPSRPPLGYRNNKLLRTIEVDPDNAPIARRMFEL